MCPSGLATLVETYLEAINSGEVPCLENAVVTLAERENAAAVQKAADLYSDRMARLLSLPTDTFLELLEVHAACEKEAIAVFMERSFKDDKQEFQKKLVVMCPRICPSCFLSSRLGPRWLLLTPWFMRFLS